MVTKWHPKWQKDDKVVFGWQQGGIVREASEWYRSGIQSGNLMAECLEGGNKVALLSEGNLSGIQVASKWQSGHKVRFSARSIF